MIQCPIWGLATAFQMSNKNAGKPRTSKRLTLNCSGSCCYDWSMMGSKKELNGSSARFLAIRLVLMMLTMPDIIVPSLDNLDVPTGDNVSEYSRWSSSSSIIGRWAGGNFRKSHPRMRDGGTRLKSVTVRVYVHVDGSECGRS